MEAKSQRPMFQPPSVSNLVVGNDKCPLLIGTSGYSYTEWSDNGFYPVDTRTGDMLGLYMQFFPVVELNYTWYQMPRAEAVARMIARVPKDFLFAAKLVRTLTHERSDEWQKHLQQYLKGIAPLKERLAAILVQLPPDFTWNEHNRRYLARLLDGLHGLSVAVEFRHVSWAIDSVFAELERRRVTLVTVDVPPSPELFPPLDVVTNSDFFYARFHGRNVNGWNSGNMQKKFDYDYSPSELREWAQGPLRSMMSNASRGILFFNNHVRAQAPRNARELQRIVQDCA
jgi:uncharacterized protein YecE (DUF72 family)